MMSWRGKERSPKLELDLRRSQGRAREGSKNKSNTKTNLTGYVFGA
jgi:hypothetical protein